ncbi:hypothetical protein ACE1TI_07780 [Alteribacillus sp. JSM 102045]|uniref:hypothetical protein n=1 Tax=Alteribacillus sp. JSM 102045 TaxID=1562101 RepID=UPI0035BF8592
MNNHMHMYNLCQQHIGQYVMVQTKNNELFNGYIENVDENNVYLMVPEHENDNYNMNNHNMYGNYPNNVMHQEMNNNYNMHYTMPQQMNNNHMENVMPYSYPSKQKNCGCNNREDRQFYGFGGYPYYYPYPRFRQLILPLAALVALSALPYY